MSAPPPSGSESWAVSNDALAELRHDLRTPLNQIIGYSEILLETAEEQAHSAYLPDLQKIHNAATDLVDLINAHLVPARLAAARHTTIWKRNCCAIRNAGLIKP